MLSPTSASSASGVAAAAPNKAEYPGWSIIWKQRQEQWIFKTTLPDGEIVNVWYADRPVGDEIANPLLVKRRVDAKRATQQYKKVSNASAASSRTASVSSGTSTHANHNANNTVAITPPIAQPTHVTLSLQPPTLASSHSLLTHSPLPATPTRVVTTPPSAAPLNPLYSTPPTTERAHSSPPALPPTTHPPSPAPSNVSTRPTATVHADYLQTLAQSHSDYLFGAFAELIHNAVDWQATSVDISCIVRGTSRAPLPSHTVLIADNGCGMSKKKLEEMMRFGKERQVSIGANNRPAHTGRHRHTLASPCQRTES